MERIEEANQGQNVPPAIEFGQPWQRSTPEERRRRRRRPYRQPGWIYRGDQVTQVHMRNVSGDGAGFVCDADLRKAEKIHLKAGIGSTRRPRPAEVVFTRQRPDGRFDVGVRFIR